MAATAGMMFVAAVFLLPDNLREVAVQGEAQMLARNINDAARQVYGIPASANASVEFHLPQKVGDQNYSLLFWGGNIWIVTHDGRFFNYSTPVPDSYQVYNGGDTLILPT